jgi:predicted nucleotidyltransferase component of viral defense system
MKFVHEEPGFASFLTQVADQTGIAPALVEKDYWITHALWALHETGLDLWLKGGTSLSKGFGIIERFSEDLDLMVERGCVATLPDVSS